MAGFESKFILVLFILALVLWSSWGQDAIEIETLVVEEDSELNVDCIESNNALFHPKWVFTRDSRLKEEMFDCESCFRFNSFLMNDIVFLTNPCLFR